MVARVGFIGLGHIGADMAESLVAPAFELTVFDVAPAAMARFEGIARLAGCAADVGRHSEIVGVCVRDDQQLRTALMDPQGLLEGLGREAIILVHSTVRATTIRELAGVASERGVDLIDAAVSRTVYGKASRFVCSMVGGDPALLERARPVLEAFSTAIVHAGPLGSGMVIKTCNNLVTFIEYTAAHESFRLAAANGVDPAVLRRVMTENGNLTPSMAAFIESRATGPARLGQAEFAELQTRIGKLSEKDLDVALDLARDSGLTLAATERVRALILQVFTHQAARQP
ncbi:MAG: putative oxidoreductase [Gammaproteobacteria bacterium]|jgi:3-hydroxyisobutyrate dehydrogenase|nr:putative oxidoreductase [Gammaproteobacteria bacterium]